MLASGKGRWAVSQKRVTEGIQVLRGSMSSLNLSIGKFHVVVVQRTSRKCTMHQMCDTRARAQSLLILAASWDT